jgi:phosphatidate cytidylyltransferase
MALNKEVFKTRTLTALIFVAVMLAGLLWNFWSFVILFSIIHFGCWFEYLKLAEKIHASVFDSILKWLFAICGFVPMIVLGIQHYNSDIYINLFSQSISLKLLGWLFIVMTLLLLIKNNPDVSAKAVWMGFAGFLYISLSMALFLNLRDISFHDASDDVISKGKIITCGIIFSIWINDTMAYIVGSLIGKTPFSKISPKKTWEGTGGGAVLCVVVIGLLGYFIPAAKEIAVQHWIAIAAICAIFGTAGDLLESKIKRMADVKDSGTIMPGHGGFLDRFDSLLVASPFVWLYIKLFV